MRGTLLMVSFDPSLDKTNQTNTEPEGEPLHGDAKAGHAVDDC